MAWINDDPRNEPDYGEDDYDADRADRAAERYESDLLRQGE